MQERPLEKGPGIALSMERALRRSYRGLHNLPMAGAGGLNPKGRGRGEETTSLKVATVAGRGTAKSFFALHVMQDGHVTSYPLERGHSLVVGRSPEADVRVDDPVVSRKHVRIDVGDTVTISDLGSANGVRVGAHVLTAHQQAPLEPGTVVELGSAALVVQATAGASAPRRIWSHGYFEGRVQDECARAERVGGAFAVLRVRVSKDSEAAALDALSQALAPADLVAVYSPGEIEALVLQRASFDAASIASSVVASLAAKGLAARAGAASYPVDGRAGDSLLALAEDRLAPPRRPSADKRRRIYGQHLDALGRVLGRIARGDINIVVTGETGTGKEIVAEMIHRLSPRAKKPIVRLNCGAFTETLLASELFGYERGAFTGADRAKPGLLETADGGTVFLDEIGELPLSLQPKLLRVIEEGEVMRVGALKPKHIDVRFVSATHRDLDGDSLAGRFRRDLYFRLAGYTAVIAPLRERAGEIAQLARGFLDDAAAAMGAEAPVISPAALAVLEAYPWPGNARELRNVMQRAHLLADSGTIGVEHLPADRLTMRVAAPSHVQIDQTHTPTLGGPEGREKIVESLARFGGNQTYAARDLGISRNTLLARMDSLGITRPRKKPPVL